MRPHHALGLAMIEFFVELTTRKDGVTADGHEHLASHPRTLYISNHDDIVSEAGLIERELARAGLPLAHLSAGQNIFDNPTFAPIRSLMPMFPVPRERGSGLAVAEAIERTLDAGHSVWVAQTPGRSKDGRHETHPDILLNLATVRNTTIDRLVAETAIQPIAVSMEYEPTGPQLARILVRRKKRYGDDFVAVTKGLWGHKGRAHVAFAPRITGRFNDEVAAAHAIDDAIQRSYKCFDTHRQAYKERSRLPFLNWPHDPPDLSRISDERLRRQLRRTPEQYRAALLTRYAMPEYERRKREEV